MKKYVHIALILSFALLLAAFITVIIGRLAMECVQIDIPHYQYRWVSDLIQTVWADYCFDQQSKIHPISIPVKLIEVPGYGVYPIVKIKLNNRLEALFLLDTGASTLFIDNKLAQKFKVNTVNLHMPIEYKGGIGNGIVTQAIYLDSVSIGPIVLHNKIAFVDAGNISKIFPYFGINGILGANILRNKCFTIDYKNQCVTFYKPKQIKDGEHAVPFAIENVSEEFCYKYLLPALTGPLPIIRGELDGQEQLFLVDTGCAYNVAGGNLKVPYSTERKARKFKLLKLGSITLKNPIFLDIKYPAPHSVLGTGFQRNFNVRFDYYTGQIFLTKNCCSNK